MIKASDRGTYVLLLIAVVDVNSAFQNPLTKFVLVKYSGPDLEPKRLSHTVRTAVAA